MSKSKKKKLRKRPNELTDASDQLQVGMPAKDSIREVVTFVSPQKTRYKILKTTERDAYDSVETQRRKSGPKS
jgi:hypothetical protein